jgi:hypothetical protein
MNFGFKIPRRSVSLFEQGVASGAKTSISNPDFSEFPANDSSPDGTYGWRETSDPSNSVSIAQDVCIPPFKCVHIEAGANNGFTWIHDDLLQGGRMYEIKVLYASFVARTFSVDAFINDVAQVINQNIAFVDTIISGTCDLENYVEETVILDASGIGNFNFGMFLNFQTFDSIRIRRVTVNAL